MNLQLSDYDHLLLDMNGTFVMDFDNFGPEQDFGQTYRELGYTTMIAELADHHVRAAYDYMAVRYIDEAYYHDFPSVAEAVRATSAPDISETVVAELVDTFAMHELGHVPPDHVAALRQLAETHPLSVLSNLWAPKDRWLTAFEQWGIAPLFSGLHFSSDGREMKPHTAFFSRALDAIREAQPDARVLYIGDSYRCDVLGARDAGIDSVWLHRGRPVNNNDQLPTAVFADLRELVQHTSAAMSVK